MDRRERYVRRRDTYSEDEGFRRRRDKRIEEKNVEWNEEEELIGDALFRRKLYGGSWFAYTYTEKS